MNLGIVRALTFARSIGYWRDKGSLMWSFVVPPVLIVCMALAFSGEDPAVFRIGVLTPTASTAPAPEETLAAESRALPPVLQQPFIERIGYPDLKTALTRVRHHQLDLMVASNSALAVVGADLMQARAENQTGDRELYDTGVRQIDARDDRGKSDDNATIAAPTPMIGLTYWINPGARRGEALEALLTANPDFALTRVAVSGQRVRYVDWVVPGILGMNLMFSGLFGVGYIIVRYRKNGVLKRLSATPVRPVEFLTAQLLSRFAIMLVVAISVYTAANLTLDLLMLGSYWTLALIAVCGNLALISLALVITARIRSDELAGGLLNLVSLPMLLLSEVWFSLDAVPRWMQQLSQMLPLTHLVQAARKVMVEGASLGEVSHHLFILLGIALVCTLAAARIFRWE